MTRKQFQENQDAPIVALHHFCRAAGFTPITAWRMRKKGWLSTINIAGRQYVTAEAIAEFKRRAVAGEFAQDHKTPKRAQASPA